MPFSYNPLWKLLIDKKMTKEELKNKIEASPTTIAKMGRGENISFEILDRICNTLNCRVEDVIEFVKSEEE